VTNGPDLAERQLRELAAVSGGSLEILGTEEAKQGRWLMISMDTSGIVTTGTGVRVRSRERFNILVGSGYPFRPPVVQVAHRRWAGTAHVQWGSQLCLYAAPSVEWAPADGMNGFLERLSTWVVRAAQGTLDPDGQPLHPPAVYARARYGTVVVHPDLGHLAPWSSGGADLAAPKRRLPRTASLVAWCTAKGNRLDIVEWLDWSDTYTRVLAEEFEPFLTSQPIVVMPALLIDDLLGFEYPQKAWGLVTALENAGFSLDDLLHELANAMLVNRLLRSRQLATDPAAAGRPVGIDSDDEDPSTPLVTGLLVGTPARRVHETRLTHLAAWSLGGAGTVLAGVYADHRGEPDQQELLAKIGDIARDWLREADARWMRVLENRPETTQRRDHGTAATWLAGKRVLILGCGAIGAPVAEHCVRAGVSTLHVVDNGLVTPGILVRQPYQHAGIGEPKAEALAERLSAIRADLKVEGWVEDAVDLWTQPEHRADLFDLIIDATADAGVRSAIERQRQTDDHPWPTVTTMIIGYDASRGLVTTSTPAATQAGAGALRHLALHAFAHPRDWADIADDFFPDQPRADMFFPEPGCSAPTFVGAAAQTAALAGMLLHETLLALHGQTGVSADSTATTFASAVRIGEAARHGTSRTQWGPDTTAVDDTHAYQVRLSPAAVAEMRTEIRRGARVRGRRIETGGMLLGAIEDAAGVIFVDRVTGPPPDSFLSEIYFQHGRIGAQEAVTRHLTNSRRMTGFLGYWHTHPDGRAAPSPTDEEGMASVVTPDGRRQRALMVIVAGTSRAWDQWVSGDGPPPALFARLVPRSHSEPKTTDAETVLLTQRLPDTPFFRGGFSDGPARAEPHSPAAAAHSRLGRSRWWRLQRGRRG
jgi:integrative and conjugative element protein (TIGR02256 family)